MCMPPPSCPPNKDAMRLKDRPPLTVTLQLNPMVAPLLSPLAASPAGTLGPKGCPVGCCPCDALPVAGHPPPLAPALLVSMMSVPFQECVEGPNAGQMFVRAGPDGHSTAAGLNSRPIPHRVRVSACMKSDELTSCVACLPSARLKLSGAETMISPLVVMLRGRVGVPSPGADRDSAARVTNQSASILYSGRLRSRATASSWISSSAIVMA